MTIPSAQPLASTVNMMTRNCAWDSLRNISDPYSLINPESFAHESRDLLFLECETRCPAELVLPPVVPQVNVPLSVVPQVTVPLSVVPQVTTPLSVASQVAVPLSVVSQVTVPPSVVPKVAIPLSFVLQVDMYFSIMTAMVQMLLSLGLFSIPNSLDPFHYKPYSGCLTFSSILQYSSTSTCWFIQTSVVTIMVLVWSLLASFSDCNHYT